MNISYLGFFGLPRGRQDHDVSEDLAPYAKFGFGGRAMCLADDDTCLWISGHEVGDLIAKVRIPDVISGGEAEMASPFREAVPAARLHEEKLDTLVGIADFGEEDPQVYSLWQQFYDVAGGFTPRDSLWNGIMFRRLADGNIKKTSGYMTQKDDILYFGRSHGAGNVDVPHGPILFHEFEGLVMQHERSDWTPADQYTAVALIGDCPCWVVSKAVGSVWYGGAVGPNGEVDKWETSKGYRTDEREVWLLPYSEKYDPLEPIVLSEFHQSSHVGGMVYSEKNNRLYVYERWPPDNIYGGPYRGEAPKIHVYEVVKDLPPVAEPYPISEIRITIDGVGTFLGTGTWSNDPLK